MSVLRLSPLEQECLEKVKALPAFTRLATKRLEDDVLLITGYHAGFSSQVAMFVVDEIPDVQALDELYDWCIGELWGDDPWMATLACSEDGIGNENEIIAHYEQQKWGIKLHVIPREALARQRARTALPAGYHPTTLAQILDLMKEGRGNQPNMAIDEAIGRLSELLNMAGQSRPEPRALPHGSKVLTISAKAL